PPIARPSTFDSTSITYVFGCSVHVALFDVIIVIPNISSTFLCPSINRKHDSGSSIARKALNVTDIMAEQHLPIQVHPLCPTAKSEHQDPSPEITETEIRALL